MMRTYRCHGCGKDLPYYGGTAVRHEECGAITSIYTQRKQWRDGKALEGAFDDSSELRIKLADASQRANDLADECGRLKSELDEAHREIGRLTRMVGRRR